MRSNNTEVHNILKNNIKASTAFEYTLLHINTRTTL